MLFLGCPSSEKMEKAGAEEKKRISQQVEKLGPQGLKEKADILEKAVAKNGVGLFAFSVFVWPLFIWVYVGL